jgi:hypothetical protein
LALQPVLRTTRLSHTQDARLAAEREARQIDEKLFLETYAQPAPERAVAGRRR